ncbi:hypothetical protein C7M84_016965 [Penaeus vannamei]|uniref:Poly [ADP-ribose] polymerase n=1 Tax=Penaeus vannamei TaxID=6689 RepID=A0A423SLR0_PENVA|nr:hypothetical protein C7M84_016965 [Penaeus vannamei]
MECALSLSLSPFTPFSLSLSFSLTLFHPFFTSQPPNPLLLFLHPLTPLFTPLFSFSSSPLYLFLIFTPPPPHTDKQPSFTQLLLPPPSPSSPLPPPPSLPFPLSPSPCPSPSHFFILFSPPNLLTLFFCSYIHLLLFSLPSSPSPLLPYTSTEFHVTSSSPSLPLLSFTSPSLSSLSSLSLSPFLALPFIFILSLPLPLQLRNQKFAAHDAIQHRKLLWHGTNVAVVAAILKAGLRIMPHSGGRVGRGIYFASEHAKSSYYVGYHYGTYEGESNVGFMFLVEVALGKENNIMQDDCSLTQAPKGYESVVARGKTEPDPKKNKKLVFEGKDVIVPVGKPVPQKEWARSSFSQSEYLVYKESQARIRYLLKFSFK